jgi:hypothetical protein
MKRITIIAFAFVSLNTVLFTACKKQGPQGPAGPQGVAGPIGPTGAQGPIGTANVIYSRWTNGSTWAIDGASGLNYFDMTATSLTQGILNGGSIQVYWAVLGDTVNNVRQLPFTETIGASIYFHNPKYSVGKIRIETSNFSMAASNRYRFILIPGGILGGRYADVNFSDYNEVLWKLHLP